MKKLFQIEFRQNITNLKISQFIKYIKDVKIVKNNITDYPKAPVLTYQKNCSRLNLDRLLYCNLRADFIAFFLVPSVSYVKLFLKGRTVTPFATQKK